MDRELSLLVLRFLRPPSVALHLGAAAVPDDATVLDARGEEVLQCTPSGMYYWYKRRRWYGSGTYDTQQKRLRLYDSEGKELTEGVPTPTPPVVRANEPPTLEWRSKWIEQVQAMEKQLGHPESESCAGADLRIGNTIQCMPILWWTQLTQRMRAPSDGVRYFEHWLTQLRDGATDAQALCDLISLDARRRFEYAPDRTPLGEETEQWIPSLWAVPDGVRIVGDCEDQARACMEMFHALRQLPLPTSASPRLRRIWQLAQQYEAWLVLGELRQEGSTYAPHCYLALLDTRSIEPALIVDNMVESPSPKGTYGRVFALVSTREHVVVHAGVRADQLFASTKRWREYVETALKVDEADKLWEWVPVPVFPDGFAVTADTFSSTIQSKA